MATPESIAAFRFGYGFRPGEEPLAAEAMLAGVPAEARAARGSASTIEERAAVYRRFVRLRRQLDGDSDGAAMAEVTRARREIARGLAQARAARVAAAVETPNPLYERLVWFWSDHFSVSALTPLAQAIVPAFEPDAIRPNVAGRFVDLLRAAVTHPAMLEYLSQSRSVGPDSAVGRARQRGLNENLAREALELHTLGVGGDYTQADVRQFAELLTGLSVSAKGGFAFRPDMAEPGAEVVLGHRYGGKRPSLADIDGALADLARHPATARHIATKLAVHFVADAPDPGLVDALADAWTGSGGELMPVYETLVAHPASAAPLGAKVRQPFEFVVASLRAAGPAVPPPGGAGHPAGVNPVAALQRMNQPIWRAPQPNGWPEQAAAWISPPGLTARIDWASALAAAIEADVDPRAFLDDALRDLASDETRAVVRGAAERWEGIALVLASPEFNRR